MGRVAVIELEDTLEVAVTWVLVMCSVWLGAVTLLMTIEALTTGRIHRTGPLAPRALRTLVATACGIGLAAALTGPAAAETVDGVPPFPRLDGLQLPDRAVGRSSVEAARPQVTVRRGDSLWALAERHETSWPQLYRTNRAVVGDDPDLIQPGMRLTLPTTEGHRQR